MTLYHFFLEALLGIKKVCAVCSFRFLSHTPRNRSKLEEYSVFLIFLIFPTIFLRFPHLPYVFPLYHSAPYSSFSFGGICSMTGIFPGRGIFLPGRGIFRGKACTFFSFSVVYILISCFAFRLVRRQTRRVNNKSMNFWKFTTLYFMLHSVLDKWACSGPSQNCSRDTERINPCA